MAETSQTFYGFPIPIASAIMAGLAAIIVCFINYWISNKKIKADKETFYKKLQVDIVSQSSKTYKELITSQRIVWLNLLRESMAEYMSRTYLLLSLKANKSFLCGETQQVDFEDAFVQKQFDPYYEAVKASFLIQLRLNPKQDNHKKLVKDMNDLDQKVAKYLQGEEESLSLSDISIEVQEFAISCQELLKKEWEFVKIEAKPKEPN